MAAREGDYIETSEGLIFDVKGLVHPPNRIIAFIRYFPDKKGKRRRGERFYDKVYSLADRYKLLKKRFPQYLVHDPVFDEVLCEVPTQEVKKHYKPVSRLEELRHTGRLDALENRALQFAEELKRTANIPWNSLGISGSVMVGLHTENSDIDPVVYGSENCRKAHSALKKLLKDVESPFKPYTREELRKLFSFRAKDTAMNFEDFVRTEERKVLQGKFQNGDYFMRFVKDWREITAEYGALRYQNVGYAKIRAAVEMDSEAIFTPCTYKIRDVETLEGASFPVEEICSFRGRFCEQARTGEAVVAQGKVERVIDDVHNRAYHRVLLGNKASDYMVLA